MRHLWIPSLFLLAASSANAQSHLPTDLLDALNDWRTTSSDPNWELIYDMSPLPSGQQASRMLLGGGFEHSFRPQTENARFLLARYFINQAVDLFLLDSNTLVNDRTIELPLGMVGGTDKVTVRFRQVIDGVPVEHGYVNVLFDLSDWTLLSIDSMAIAGVSASTSLVATVSDQDAIAVAVAQFEAETGMNASTEVTSVLEVCDHQTPVCKGTLVWKVTVADDGSEPEVVRSYCVAATGTPAVVEAEDRIRDAFPQQGGGGPTLKVKAWVTATGDCGATCVNPCCYIPDDATTPGRTLVKLPYLRVTDATGQMRITDANGEFTFPNAVYPLTYQLKGPHVDVRNAPLSGSDLSVTSNVIGTVILNPAPSEYDVAQTNAFHLLGQMKKWVEGVNPLDHVMDGDDFGNPYVVIANQKPGFLLRCNAYYSVPDMELGFTRSGQGPSTFCQNNAAFSTIVWHEMGHWLSDRYGDQQDDNRTGFAEGLADTFALYKADFHIVGNNFRHLGDGRNGLDVSEQWCSDRESLLQCGREHHLQGKVLMGAMWKTRVQLAQALGDASLAAAVTDSWLFAWMNAFDQNRIHSIIQYQLMVLDDDNHDWTDGSPNQAAISSGFSAQGFPPFASAALGEHITTVIQQ